MKTINTLITECKSSKQWWSITRNLLKTNDGFEALPPIEIDDRIITDDKEKACAFNNFFLEASSLDDSNKELPHFHSFLKVD